MIICPGCAQAPKLGESTGSGEVIPGAWRTELYLDQLQDKQIGLVVNHTSFIAGTHLADSLSSLGLSIKSIFAPEHGFRGQADAGAHIRDTMDERTGIRVISLYGEKKKPTRQDLKEIEVLVFDIQDVGARFYTYISTLHYVMEAAGEADIPMIVLDRPNPNGHYVDGPLLDTAYRSFVGMHPVPVVYGMTIGEYARMINGEKWIRSSCRLEVIPCANYDHQTMYELPVRPSPNLPNLRSVLLYPSLCFFEGTPMSVGRGTDQQFQVIGHPAYPDKKFSFTPRSMPGAVNPPLKDQLCFGIDLSSLDVDSVFSKARLDLSYLIATYYKMERTDFFNTGWFDKLAGGPGLRTSIEAGRSEEWIRESWKEELIRFENMRNRYLLYP